MVGELAAWEQRVADLWAALDAYDEGTFVARMDALVAELPAGSAIGLFERGAARDSTGRPDQAVPLYAAALDAGVGGERRRRAVIQMASSLRNLGQAQEALALLEAEAAATSDALDGAVATFRALALVDLGREREAVAVALQALTTYLPRYNRSVARYAQALIDDDPSNDHPVAGASGAGSRTLSMHPVCRRIDSGAHHGVNGSVNRFARGSLQQVFDTG